MDKKKLICFKRSFSAPNILKQSVEMFLKLLKHKFLSNKSILVHLKRKFVSKCPSCSHLGKIVTVPMALCLFPDLFQVSGI
jgi:hypothetical protein